MSSVAIDAIAASSPALRAQSMIKHRLLSRFTHCAAGAVLGLLAASCSDVVDRAGGGEGGSDGGGGGASPCPAGHVAGPAGGCMPVGIQGCAAPFMGDDNLCHPSMTRCATGTIPKFDEGCVAVGIPACAPEFVES